MFKSNGGFTLVELIVVIAILGILAGLVVPSYSQYIEKAKGAQTDIIEGYNKGVSEANKYLDAEDQLTTETTVSQN